MKNAPPTKRPRYDAALRSEALRLASESRSISWWQWNRRLSRDFECFPNAAEATIYLASIRPQSL